MSDQSEHLKKRTMQFAVDVLRLIDRFPPSISGTTVGRQLAKSATSVGANYRATCNARSRPEFIARLGVVVEEADESVFWLDLSVQAKLAPATAAKPVCAEAVELRAIFARSLGTARTNLERMRNH